MPTSTTQTNVAPALTSFIGRQDELAALSQYVAGHRLTTVLGAAGVGKTRFVEHWALTSPARSLSSGAWYCNLAQARTLEEIGTTLARVMGISLAAPSAVADLGRAIGASGTPLILLDGVERIVGLLGAVIPSWMAQASGARWVIASRRALEIRAEAAFHLGPLSKAHAVELFVARARMQSPFAASDAELLLVEKLVDRLDGLPLAIELAAGRMGVLSIETLLERLELGFGVLRSDLPTDSPSHATLEQAIDESWDCLSAADQEAFARCAVFCGGFSLDAAAAVLASGADASAALERLCARSLLFRDWNREIGRPRFSLYESLRDFGARKLEAMGQRKETEARHSAYFVRCSREWMDSFGALRTPEYVRLEIDNLLEVRRRSVGADPGALVDTTLVLERLIADCGPYDWLHALLTDALEVVDDTNAEGIETRCRLLVGRAECLRLSGLSDAAEQEARQASQLAAACGRRGLEARALTVLGRAKRDRGWEDDACAHFADAVEAGRAADDPATLASALAELGYLRDDTTQILEAIAIARASGHRRVEALAVGMLGVLTADQGHAADGKRSMDESLRLIGELGDHGLEAIARCNIGAAHLAWGETEDARRELHHATVLARRAGDRLYEVLSTGTLALALYKSGDLEGSELRLRELMFETRHLFHPWKESFLSALLGLTLAGGGKIEAARACQLHAREMSVGIGFRDYPLLLEALSAMTDLAEADQTAEPEQAGVLVSTAQQKLALARSTHHQGPSSLGVAETRRPSAMRIAWVRISVTMLEDALALRGAAELPANWRIEVGDACRWVTIGDGASIDLRRRKTLRQVLEGLLERRLNAPGTPVPPETIIGDVWPEARDVSSCNNRLYNAIATLRQLGLKDVLVTHEGGYLIDPRAIVVTPRS